MRFIMGFVNSKKIIAYDELKEKIITNVLRPGQIVNEKELSNELNTSKTPVREALQQLEKEGFIENIYGKGFFVSRISVQDLQELYEIRGMLECAVAGRAALMANTEKVAAVKKNLETSACQAETPAKGYIQVEDLVHTLMFEIYGNTILMDLYKRLQDRIIRTRAYLRKGLDSVRVKASYNEHMEILNALAAKDPARAEAAVRTHLNNGLESQWNCLKSGS
jgi:GntR family transcriptional regulator, rspAB operon transcriptional repressor